MPCDWTRDLKAPALPCALYKVILTREGSLSFTYFTHLGGESQACPQGECSSDPEEFFLCLAPEDRDSFVNGLREASSTVTTYRSHHRAFTRRGEVRWLFTEACPSRLSNGETLFSGVTLDITESLRSRDALLRVQKLESIERLAGGMAHDFNNLLQAIVGNISLAKLRIADPESAMERLLKAEQACVNAKDLSASFYTFAVEGRGPAQTTSVEETITDMVEGIAAARNVRARVKIAPGLPRVGMAEETLRHIITRIVSNACDAMPEGGVVRVRAVKRIVSPGEGLQVGEGDYVEITVKDEGGGIREEHLTKVFDPYFTTKQMGCARGRGLSLSICHSIVVRHHGYIDVDPGGGAGATFRILLPAAFEAGGSG